MSEKNRQHVAEKEQPRITKDMIERRRKECNPVYMPSGVAVSEDVRGLIAEVFPGGRLEYEHGFGYVLAVGQARLLIGGTWGKRGHVKAWLEDNREFQRRQKAIVPMGFWG